MKYRWFCHLFRRVTPRREGNREFGNFPRGVTNNINNNNNDTNTDNNDDNNNE